ncbi:hypothetical protein FHS55_001429 [Angulomicrobium tetraedrale]|uniref:Uncharacterized protein n=1 Tax=Ancylobacter tetraedralis TaxID=217068 RepID=A0A839Z292_9HYPH|nr:hypothetical protein [Ancylobacter tetraedralis]MBB3770834.1 hypothetical protein [Ancylobacter tetraedralis]
MWDFSIGTTFGLVARTWPFVLLRLAVYAASVLAIIAGTGLGAGVGWSLGRLFGHDESLFGAMIGGVGGLSLMLGLLWWVRQYVVYLVKAAHVAAMDALLRGAALPDGRSQIRFATAMVRARFLEVNVLFGLDLLIRGTVRAFVGVLDVLTVWIPGAGALNRFVAAVLRVALGLVDEIILAYIIRRDGVPPGDAARDGLVLYAQNAGPLARNAVWIALFDYTLSLLIFLLLLGPAVGLAYWLPGALGGLGVVVALASAWALRAALIEPLSIAALLQAYDIATRGQAPNPAWTARLDAASAAFRDLGHRPPAARGA